MECNRFSWTYRVCFSLPLALVLNVAQAGVTLDGLSGPGAGGPAEIICGQPVTFNLRVTNDAGFDLEGLAQGFRIYSPDGASWAPITAQWNPAIDWAGLYFDLNVSANLFSATGSGSDTVGFGALKLFLPGLPLGFDDVFGSISTQVPCSEQGRTLCLDSSFFPPAGSWLWVVNGGLPFSPTWDGPHCFTITGSANQPPVIDSCPATVFIAAGATGTSPPIPATDGDPLDNLTYSIFDIQPFPPLGALSIDPTDGSMQFDTDGGDGEIQFIVTVEVTDGIDSDMCDVVFEILPGFEPESFVYEVVNESPTPVGRLRLGLFNPPGELEVEPENVWLSKQFEPCGPPLIPTSPPEISDSIVLDFGFDCVQPGDTVQFLVHAQNGPIHLANAQWSTVDNLLTEPIDTRKVSKLVKRKVTVVEPKLFISVRPTKLRLKWNGDQGESGRNNGEIFATMVYSLKGEKVERANLKRVSAGPLLDVDSHNRFLSSTIKAKVPPGPPPPLNFKIEPREMRLSSDLKRHFYADCDVKELHINAIFIEGDDNKDIKKIVKFVKDVWSTTKLAAWAADVTIPFKRLISEVLDFVTDLIVELTSSPDDPIGQFSATIPLPACPDKWINTFTINLENQVDTALWKSAPAEAEDDGPPPPNSQEFVKYGFSTPPDPIGSMDIRVYIKKNGDSSSFVREITEVEIVDLGPPDLYSADLGQLDAGVINGTFNIAGLFPLDSSDFTYSMYLDVDNDFSTGSHDYPSDGAEFVAVLDMPDTENSSAELMSFDSLTNTFVTVPDGIYDFGVNDVGNLFFYDIDLATIGNPTGKVSAWCVADSAGQIFDILPSCPTVKALTIPIVSTPDDMPPTVVRKTPFTFQEDVDRTDPITIEFSESMDRASVESALIVSPPVALSYLWQGNTLSATPLDSLQPGLTYTVTLLPTMTDRGGLQLDGNADDVAGDAFSWQFKTVELPLAVFDEFGAPQDVFYENQLIFVAGSDFPPNLAFDAYIVTNHPSFFDTSNVLTDVTNDGPTLVSTDGFGALTLSLLGSIPNEGEYNVVADLNSDGLYDSTVDRRDRGYIGFTVDPDCNGNLIPDGVELTNGLALDSDGDGILDVCESGCCATPGDFDNNGSFNIADVTAGIARIFAGGPAPVCQDQADADGNNTFNIGDVTYGIARIFAGGPAPICGTTGQ